MSQESSCARIDHDLFHVHSPHLSYSTSAILREHIRRGDGSTRGEQGVWQSPISVMPFRRLRLRVNDES